jgi:MFS family permease
VLLKNRSFIYYLFARAFIMVAMHAQYTIVGLQLYYEYDRRPIALGLLGAYEAVPFILFSLLSGYTADRFNRQKIWIAGVIGFAIISFYLFLNDQGFFQISFIHGKWVFYIITIFLGILRAFTSAAVPPLLSQIVLDRSQITKAVSWSSSAWYVGAITGPAMGAFIYGTSGAASSYLVNIVLFALAFITILLIKAKPQDKPEAKESIFKSIREGTKFVFQNKIILGAISLDMLVVLFGDAIALLPVFSDEVLHLDPKFYGYLRMAPALGALITSLILAKFAPLTRTGNKLLICVACFGVLNILMGLTSQFLWTFVALFFCGVFDNVSVVIRNAITQLMTPDKMRGRVSAINSIFIGSSNEIGAFECGLAAQLLGLVPAIIFGGSVTILIILLIAIAVPTLRKFELKNYQ